jgi:type IV pilus assembly protein PilW
MNMMHFEHFYPVHRAALSRGRQRGFTLVELLVSIALGLAVIVALSSVYVAAKQTFRFQETTGRMQEDANFALEQVAREVRMAGFGGCRGVDTVTVSGTPTTFPQMGLATAPSGKDSANPLSAVYPTDTAITAQPLAPANFIRGFDAVPAAILDVGGPTASAAASALFFSTASARALSVSAAMAAATDNLSIASNAYSWPTGMTMVVSDCSSSSLFVSGLSGSTAITHTTTDGNTANNFPSNNLYGVDAIVMPVEWYLYFVATRSGAAAPSLYRVFYDGSSRGNAQELIANVEDMRIHYGENINGKDTVTSAACVLASGGATCEATHQADVWRTTAAAVTDWSRVVAVRVGLMMVSSDASGSTDLTQVTPTLLGTAYTVPAGSTAGLVRKEYSTTVVLRNRVVAR